MARCRQPFGKIARPRIIGREEADQITAHRFTAREVVQIALAQFKGEAWVMQPLRPFTREGRVIRQIGGGGGHHLQ